MIHWGDETTLRSDDVHGRSYSIRGLTPVVRVNNNLLGSSVISTVTIRGELLWMVFNRILNSCILIGFLRRLTKYSERKVLLILDNLGVHQSKPVKEWLAQHVDQIEVFHLLSYSPELNPVEVADAGLKDAVTKHAPARKQGQFELYISQFLRSLQHQPERIIAIIHKDTVRYDALVPIMNAGSIRTPCNYRPALARAA